MFKLPTHSPRQYRGKYPNRINSWSYSRSYSQMVLGEFLGIKRPVHFETNEGSRYIADFSELRGEEVHLGADLEDCCKHIPTILVELSPERYSHMLELVRRARETEKRARA